MKYQFSNRMSQVEASAIRELFKTTSQADIISFAGGNPSSDAFPVDAIKEITTKILEEDPISILQYGITEGYGPLISEAEKFFNRNEKVSTDHDQAIITSGSQQIMEFAVKCLCNEGDYVFTEDPSFIGALNCFRSQGVNLKGIGLKNGELDLEELEKACVLKPKFIYVIPNFQNPSGLTMSLEIRKKLLEIAKKHQILILEDNPYGDLRFEGEPIPSIKSMDEDGLVIYAASLSKIIAPGMRIACCIGPKEIIAKFVIAKQVADIHSNLWSQRVMASFLKDYDMDAHLSRLKEIYKHKCSLMLEEMDQSFHKDVIYSRPQGGMFIWVTFPDYVDVKKFVKEALDLGVAVVPGSSFAVDKDKEDHCIRLNFSMPSDEDIIKGVSILGDLTYKFI